jgi:hypothetical protein
VKSNSKNGAMLSARPPEIETASGRFVDLFEPDPETIELWDVAHGLALTCRYGGHVRRFYSVAEHASLVHDLLAWQGRDDLRLAALFHDAAEAYLGDVVAPLKYALRAETLDLPHNRSPASSPVGVRSPYDYLTERMERAIGSRFDLDARLFSDDTLMLADMWALRIEARSLTHSAGAQWRWPGDLPEGGRKPDDVAWRGGLEWEAAEMSWIDRAERALVADRVVRESAAEGGAT